ncbi:MAG: GntR family transcriptional regulator [Clostridia bacterium]|nr:GntR family transcriptional regulator [Clostridia bacterium]
MAIKYKFLAELLREDIRQNGAQANYKIATETELMQRYHMSRQTVRHALKMLADEGVVETRQGSGTYSTGRMNTVNMRQVAIITSFLDDYIFPTILHDAQMVFSDAGYSTLVFATENGVGTERSILLKLIEHPVSGILIEGSKTALPNPNADLYQKLRLSGVPLIFLHGAYAELSNLPCVCDDNYGGGYRLTQYLMEKGHTQISGIFKSDDVQGPQRYYGMVSALRDASLPIRDSGLFWYDTQARQEMLENHDYALLHYFINNRLSTSTAVICYNDEIAFLLIKELLAAGKRVPEDVAVVSFDNSYYSQMGQVNITSLRHKGERMGRLAAEQLLHLLHGESVPTRTLRWELVQRASG